MDAFDLFGFWHTTTDGPFRMITSNHRSECGIYTYRDTLHYRDFYARFLDVDRSSSPILGAWWKGVLEMKQIEKCIMHVMGIFVLHPLF